MDRLGNMNELSEGSSNKLNILLTDAFFKVEKHLVKGKIDPKEIHGTWVIKGK